MNSSSERREKFFVVAAFAAIYVLWGSTFLAIRIAVLAMPPFLVAGSRFLAAGLMLVALERLRKCPLPSREQWTRGAVLGFMMFLVPYGALFWAEQHVASGLAAVTLATTPLFTLALEIWAFRMRELQARLAIGIVLGLGGVVLLMTDHPSQHSGYEIAGGLVLVVASAFWSMGTLMTRTMRLPRSKAMSAGVQMVTGGVFLLALSAVSGELIRLDLPQIPLRAWLSLGYLTIFGSVITFTAFVWLLAKRSPSVVATYAYVNPVVAVALGWLCLGERLSRRQLLASAIILGATALVLSPSAEPSPKNNVSLAKISCDEQAP